MRRTLLIALFAARSVAFADAAVPAPPGKGSPAPAAAETLPLPGPLLFRTASSVLDDKSRAALDAIASALARDPSIRVLEVGVHTDARGASDYNLRVSGERAQAIREALLARGVAPSRVAARGYGEERPLCSEPSPACFARNRRIELRVVDRAPR